jgi:hypothetical protein
VLSPFHKTNKSGIPLELVAIMHLVYPGSPWIRVVMTVLRLFESIKLPVQFDETSITAPYDGEPLEGIIAEFKHFLELWLSKFGSTIQMKLKLSSFIAEQPSFRFKSGPMGPSILTSHLCALALTISPTY